jgi:hypothetical protein
MQNPVTPEKIANWFTYHPPVGDQAERYERLRSEGCSLASAIEQLCPPSADRTNAIRCVREAVMWANAAIACEEPGEVA